MNECVDSDGNYVRIKESPSDNTKTGLTVQDGLTRGSEELFNEGIAQSDQNSNPEIEKAPAAFKTSYSSQSERTGAAEASKSIISNTEGKSKTENGGWASTEVKNNQSGQITVDSTEEQRYEILKDMTITKAKRPLRCVNRTPRDLFLLSVGCSIQAGAGNCSQ